MSDNDHPTQSDFDPGDEVIQNATTLLGLAFTADERAQLKESLKNLPSELSTVRDTSIPNAVPPALHLRLPQPPSGTNPPRPDAHNLGRPANIQRPPDLEEVAFWPVTWLAELIRTQQVTSVELTRMYIDRLRRYDEKLACVVTFTEDLAMQQAERADAEIQAGRYRGVLHGIPWGAKDLLAVEGYPTTWGAMPYKDQMLNFNATVVERLTAAGAVLIAKLTLGALAMGDVWFGGTTRNPWDMGEGSSGSSAGSAAAVAAGLVGFAIGSETLGSIVSPCTRCGATGLRPTFGRVSRHGAMFVAWSMDKLGPIARTVEDCAVVFNTIHGADPHDDHTVDAPFAWNRDFEPTTLRIGYYASAFEAERDNSANDNTVLDTLRSLGFKLTPVELPAFDANVAYHILLSEAAAASNDLTQNNQDDLLVRQDDDAWPNTFRRAQLIPAVAYIQANRIRTQLIQQMEKLMHEVDVIVTPSFGGNNLQLTNLTGHPCVVMPNGFTEKGTPTSISFLGRLYDETRLLQVANAYQAVTSFHQQRPRFENISDE
jgi:Asp-tRNA(Asn)/Glu-tRNA(Gln) amidotransferase A subunit family amidase